MTQFLHNNDIYIYSYSYNDNYRNRGDIYNKINMVLRYNYNCGVLNHKLGNFEEAIKYYEEAAYNKYPPAQQALSYCYKNGIYYEKSLEKYQKWYNLYLYKYIIEDVD
jgi:TPR repeat protein